MLQRSLKPEKLLFRFIFIVLSP